MTDSPKNDLQTAIDLDRLQTEARIASERVAKRMAEAKARYVQGDSNDAGTFLWEMRVTLKALRSAGLVVLPADPPMEWFVVTAGGEAELARQTHRAMIAAFYREAP